MVDGVCMAAYQGDCIPNLKTLLWCPYSGKFLCAANGDALAIATPGHFGQYARASYPDVFGSESWKVGDC